MAHRPDAPAPPAKAEPPRGSVVPPIETPAVIFEGRCKQSAFMGGYLKGVFVCALGAAIAYGLSLAPQLSGWPVWVLGLLGIPVLVAVYLRRATTRYKITTRRVEFERGIFSKRVDSLELWRVVDVSYTQSFIGRLLGNATIELTGVDQSHPAMRLHGLPQHRKLFEQLRDAVQEARLSHRPMEFAGSPYPPLG